MKNLLIDSPFAAEIDCYISVDLETAGPVPEQYALLSIGACTLLEPRQTFYAELQPDRLETTPQAQAIHQLSLQQLALTGQPPEAALRAFSSWLQTAVPAGQRPIFVAFNAPFDWMFLNHYFHHYLGDNPFGHSALDIKAFIMGYERVPWRETGFSQTNFRLGRSKTLTHNALQDAQDQADLFLQLLATHSNC